MAAAPRSFASLAVPTAGRLGRRAAATVGAVVDCLVPADAAVDPATRAAALADTTRFVGSQIASLPDFLRAPYLLALAAFELLPVLRWGRTFTALDGARRAAWLALWTDAKIGAMRNFVKLIRGCALLAYYDHPALAASLRTPTVSAGAGRAEAGATDTGDDDMPSFLRPAAGRAHE